MDVRRGQPPRGELERQVQEIIDSQKWEPYVSSSPSERDVDMKESEDQREIINQICNDMHKDTHEEISKT